MGVIAKIYLIVGLVFLWIIIEGTKEAVRKAKPNMSSRDILWLMAVGMVIWPIALMAAFLPKKKT